MKGIKILIGFTMIFTLCACNATSEDEYVRSTKKGKVVDISLSEMETMIKEGKSFPVVFTTNYCNYCMVFHEIFDEYIKNHEITMYQVILDNEPTTENENLAIIHTYFDEFYSTPGIFYVEDGKKRSYLDTFNLGISEEVIEKWVVENQLDRKK